MILRQAGKTVSTLINSVFFFWLLLAIPSIPMLISLLNGGDFGELLHPTGEFSARFLIVALMLTPLSMVLPRFRLIKWLIKRRRAIGVAAFSYAAAHTVFYLLYKGSLGIVLQEIPTLGIWTGWVAFAIFIPLALTSNSFMVKKLKSRWKPIQRFVYLAALFTLVHWIAIHSSKAALVHFAPLVLLEIFRIYRVKYSR